MSSQTVTKQDLADLEDWDEDDVESALSPIATKILPRLLIESALDAGAMRELAHRKAYCLVVQAPSEDWVLPISSAILALGPWDTHVTRASMPRGRTDEQSRHIVHSLASGERVVGVSHVLAMLPSAMLTNADTTIVLPAVSTDVLSKAIKEVTGELPVAMPEGLLNGLSFDEITGCIRLGSTPAECIDRLVRARRGKAQTFEQDDVPRFEDLHGYGMAKHWGCELIEDLAAWQKGEITWNAISSAAVLVSEPGMGKTSMIRSLAKSAGLAFVTTSVADWFARGSGHLDSVIKQIDEAFASARSRKPAILFFDEIDALPSRNTVSGRNRDYWTTVITHMLTQVDGSVNNANEGVVLIAATNHGDRLDPALIRPGRFSKLIRIEPPDAAAMSGILRQHLGSDLIGAELSAVGHLAAGAGASGAMAVEWVKHARRIARRSRRPVRLADLVEAIAPLDTRHPDLIERAAVHEAGHAVLTHFTGVGKVKSISVVKRDEVGGFVESDHTGEISTRVEMEHWVIQCLGGRAAEEVILGEASMGAGGGPSSDLARATHNVAMLHLSAALGRHLTYICNPEDIPDVLLRFPTAAGAVEADMRRLYEEASRLVRLHADIIVAVSEELQEHRQISGDRFREIIASIKAPREWMPTPEMPHG